MSEPSDLRRTDYRDRGNKSVCQNVKLSLLNKNLIKMNLRCTSVCKHIFLLSQFFIQAPVFTCTHPGPLFLLFYVKDTNCKRHPQLNRAKMFACVCVWGSDSQSRCSWLPSPTWFSKGSELCSVRGPLRSCCGSGTQRSRWSWSQTLGRPKGSKQTASRIKVS